MEALFLGWIKCCRRLAANPRAERQEVTAFATDPVSTGQRASAAVHLLGDLEPTLGP